jgi:predicted transcriptional regulator of viral defense system
LSTGETASGIDFWFGGVMTDVELTRQLRSRGLSSADIAAMARRGELDHLRRGAYAYPNAAITANDDAAALDRHQKLIRATVLHLTQQAWVSHTSAAVMHQLPVRSAHLGPVHLTRPRQSGHGRVARYIHLHGAPVPDSHVTTVDGLPVTSVARTVVDATRMLTYREGVAIADTALRGGVDGAEIEAAMTAVGRRNDIRLARSVLQFADHRSESVGESYSRVLLAEQGLPAPELQYDIVDHNGVFVGRVDFS